MNFVKKRNISIQLIRVMAMTMILCDHILMHVSFSMKSIVIQITNSGVLIFLFISGYLYGNKHVNKWMEWFKNRVIRICIPMWIFMVIDFIVSAVVWNVFNLKNVFIYIFNLQGILAADTRGGAGQLWFLTLIMICYIITPLLQWIREKNLNKNIGILTVLFAMVAQIFLAYFTDVGMVAGHTLSWCIIAIGVYVVGYFIGNKILPECIENKRIVITTVLTVAASVMVIIFNSKFDGQIIYDRIIIYYGLLVMDLWLCTIVYWLGKHIKSDRAIKIITHFDTISYEVYIVHVLILFLLMERFSVPVYIVGTLIFSYIAAWFLHGISKVIYDFSHL